jgi:hypothetical protein
MLWQHYVFRRGNDVEDLWEGLYSDRKVRLVYIAGRGFDVRAQTTLKRFVKGISGPSFDIEKATMLLVKLPDYQLSPELKQQTEVNAEIFEREFSTIGRTSTVIPNVSSDDEEDISASNALQLVVEGVLEKLTNETDIILDISSLPRMVFLSLITGILTKIVPDKNAKHALWANGVNFQILAAEDPKLDAQIKSEDPSNDLVTIPGFSSALHAETVQDWPLVWFPILGEGKVGQLLKVATSIDRSAEVCPVLPHPSRYPRRADQLVLEYKESLFDAWRTPVGNILYAHEANPFEAYRQLFNAMTRYKESMEIMGGSRLVVTPLGSKLITVAAGLACYAMRPDDQYANYSVGMPYAEGTRYLADLEDLSSSRPSVCALLLTGEAYGPAEVQAPEFASV